VFRTRQHPQLRRLQSSAGVEKRVEKELFGNIFFLNRECPKIILAERRKVTKHSKPFHWTLGLKIQKTLFYTLLPPSVCQFYSVG